MKRLLPLLLVAACSSSGDTGFAVYLTVRSDATVTDAALGQVRGLDIAVSGAQSAQRSFPVAALHREERLLVRPSVTAGGLDFSVTARDGSGAPLAAGSVTATLQPGKTVNATAILSVWSGSDLAVAADGGDLAVADAAVADAAAAADLAVVDQAAAPDLAGPDLQTTVVVLSPSSAVVTQGHTVALTANVPVTWSVVAGGVGGTIDAQGRYSAPNTFGSDQVRAVSQLNGAIGTAAMDVVAPRIEIFAGDFDGGVQDGVGGSAGFISPGHIAADARGNLYMADTLADTVRKIDLATRTVTTLAGKALQPGFVNDQGQAARFQHPIGVAVNAAGTTVYVGDADNSRVRKIDVATGFVTTAAGSGSGAGNGTLASGGFASPQGLAFDEPNQVLYVADPGSDQVMKVDFPNNQISIIANVGNNAVGLALDGRQLYVANTNGRVIQRIDLANANALTTVSGSTTGCQDGNSLAQAHYAFPYAIAADNGNTLWVADGIYMSSPGSECNALRKLVGLGDGGVTTPAGSFGNETMTASASYPAALPGTFIDPHGLLVLPSRDLILSDQGAHVLYLVRVPLP